MRVLAVATVVPAVAGVLLLTVPDQEGVVQGFGLILLVFAAIMATLLVVELTRRRRR